MATTTSRAEKKPKQTPVHKVRVGSTTATIWENDGENGPWYNTSVVRSYKTADEEYEDTNSYLESQLLELAAAAQLAHAWIVERHVQNRAKDREAGSR